jgi:hypothetical protein
MVLAANRQALPGVGHRLGHRLGVLQLAVRHRLVADVHGVALDPDRVALPDPFEDPLTQVVQEWNAGAHQHLGAEVRIAAGDRRFGVEDRGDIDGDQRVGRHPVEVDVVDHRDVAGAEASDQPLRTAVQAGGAEDRTRFRGPGPAQRG